MVGALPVSNEQVAAYKGAIGRYAHGFARLGHAEFDDLEQVGMIRVWTLLSRGYNPTKWAIRAAMKDEVRKAARQGMGGYEPIPDALTFDHSAPDVDDR